MKKRIYTIFLILALLSAIWAIWVKGKVLVPYVPVVSFSSQLHSIDSFSLSKLLHGGEYQLLLHEQDLSLLKRWFPHSDTFKLKTVASYQELLLTLGDKQVSFIPWYKLTKNMRILRLDCHYFFDVDDLNKYPYVANVFELNRHKIPKYSRQKVTSIAVGGTVVLSRGIGNIIDRTDDVLYPWQQIAPVFRAANLAIVNFKSPLTYSYTKPASRWMLYGKANYAKGLVFAGIDIVSIAGNHIGDAGVSGIEDTMDILDKLNIRHAGVARSMDAALQPVIKEVNGLKVGFMAINTVGPESYTGRGGIKYYIAGFERQLIAEKVAQVKDSCDILIAMPNWGLEYVARPTAGQQEMGRFLIDLGFDLVLGDQAHWVQAAEFYKGGFISYGLSNLVFDQSWSKETREGIIERFFFIDNRLVSIDIIPVYLHDLWYTEVSQDPQVIGSVMSKLIGKGE